LTTGCIGDRRPLYPAYSRTTLQRSEQGGTRMTRPRIDAAETTAASPKQPCLRCGEETAVGSVRYSDRLPAKDADGADGYLCGLCVADIRGTRRGRKLTDEEVRSLARTGSLLDQAWFRN
jgi:hypothetical protein